MFSTNSGSANISISNRYNNGLIILDQKAKTIDFAAPTSTVIKNNIMLDGYNDGEEINFTEVSTTNYNLPYFIQNANYTFLVSNTIDLFIGGGGSGGNQAVRYTPGGAGGGAGAAKIITNIGIIKGSNYTGYIGLGGNGAYANYYDIIRNIEAGGTTYFMNYSAIGGSANGMDGSGNGYFGSTNNNSNLSNFGGGGGNCRIISVDSRQNNPATWSNISSYIYKGSPGGGNGAISWDYEDSDGDRYTGGVALRPTNGINGTGGGGGGGGYGDTFSEGGRGGTGTIRIKFYK